MDTISFFLRKMVVATFTISLLYLSNIVLGTNALAHEPQDSKINDLSNQTLISSEIATTAGVEGLNQGFGHGSKKVSANQLLTIVEGEADNPDTTLPVIFDIESRNITTTSATISWQTDEFTDGQIEYGVSNSYGEITAVNTVLSNIHVITINNLSSGTVYHFRVLARDDAGNLAVSNDLIFTTNNQEFLLVDDFNDIILDDTKGQDQR